MDHLELLEKFLDKKAEKMARMKEKRLLEEKINKIKKEIAAKRQDGVNEQDISDLISALNDLEEEVSPTLIEDPKNAKYDLQKELEESMSLSNDSGLDSDNNDNVSHFDDFDSKSMDIKNFQLTDRDANPEQQAKEEYMRKLMSFRKDELILPEESDDCQDDCDAT